MANQKPIDPIKLGNAIRVIRVSLGMSRGDVVKITGKSLEQLGRIERGENTTLPQIEKIASALNTKISTIFEMARGDAWTIDEPNQSRLGEVRRENGMSLRELSEKTKIRVVTLKKYESGEKHLPIRVAKVLAKALEVEPASLLIKIEPKSPTVGNKPMDKDMIEMYESRIRDLENKMMREFGRLEGLLSNAVKKRKP